MAIHGPSWGSARGMAEASKSNLSNSSRVWLESSCASRRRWRRDRMSERRHSFARLMPCMRPSHPQTSHFVPPGSVSDYPARPRAIYRDSPHYCRRHLPVRCRRARVGSVLLGRKSLLHRVGNFSLKPRFFSGFLVDEVSRGAQLSKNPCYSLIFRDFSRDGLAADWEHSQLYNMPCSFARPAGHGSPKVMKVNLLSKQNT